MALILDKTEQKIVDIIDAHRNEIIAFAKDIYTHAELGYKEYRTAEKFASFMKNLGLETKEGLAVTGVKAYLIMPPIIFIHLNLFFSFICYPPQT